MPELEEHYADLKSTVADLANVSGSRFAGMLVAGTYLREFVADGVQWAHIDVAGPAFNTGGPHGYTPKGGTGVPVRTIAAVPTRLAGDDVPALLEVRGEAFGFLGPNGAGKSSTMRMICDSTVLPPTAVARIAKAPF